MIEVRSYRRVFDLERRIYRVDRLRLNPGGIPVRGVVYLLGVLAATLLAAHLPLIDLVVRDLPWFMLYLAFPGAVASLLAVIRIEGRPFHLAARSLLRFHVGARELFGLRPARRSAGSSVGERWRPSPILMVADGGYGVRRLRYTGPGALRVAVAHECKGASGLLVRLGLRPHVRVRQTRGAAPTSSAAVLLDRGARLSVRC